VRRWPVAFFSAAPLAVIAAGFGLRWWNEERQEQQHAEADETQIVIGAPKGAHCRLYETGRTVETPRLLRDEPCRGMWLSAGIYFMAVSAGSIDFRYPVPVRGYRLGPDREGSFMITVRQRLPEDPFRALPGSPGFAFIPSGHFLIGDRETPREPHYVWLPAFFIATFEVTNAEFRAFLLDTNGYAADIHWTDHGREWKRREESQTTASLSRADTDYRRFGRDDQPVTGVTWFEASAYCRWLTASRGGGRWTFALPSDAEWEKAARGPDGFNYGLSATISDAETKLYNWRKNPGVAVTVIGLEKTKRSFRPNRYGLYHASGNVAEWTNSAFWPYNRDRPYRDDQRNLPGTAGSRTVRGGSWYSATSATLYLAYRDAFEPNHRSNDVGFRIVAKLNP
jgi:formylglycine-generating enzyme required for sulfatase activity